MRNGSRKKKVLIGNAQGFWGDQPQAALNMLKQQPDIDFLTFDYLAEVSLAIMAMQKEKNRALGYAKDFLEELRCIAPYWKEGRGVRIVANAGGLNPSGLAAQAAAVLQQEGLPHCKIGVVFGDDVLDIISRKGEFPHLDTKEPVDAVRERLVAANAYLGEAPVSQALDLGADVVITGRVADPSLTVACCRHAFGWGCEDLPHLAQATVAGHLIECGTQVTGGISTHWLEVPNSWEMGFPLVEMSEDGAMVITKPKGTGGMVTEETVKEQLLYEIGDPENFITPDVTVSLQQLTVAEEGQDRVRVAGAQGKKATASYKVCAVYREGFFAEGYLTFFGRDVKQKAELAADNVLKRVQEKGYVLDSTRVECIGAGDAVFPLRRAEDFSKHAGELVLRLAVKSQSQEAVACFASELASLVTSGPQGVTGYFGGRPRVRPLFGYWPCLVEKSLVSPQVKVFEAGALR